MPKRLILLACLLAAGCAGSDGDPANRTVWVTDGPPVNCITKSQVRTFRVVDDRTVDFERNRNIGWRNELPMRCNGLTFGTKFRVNSRGNQLCNFDSITPVSMSRGPNPMRCQLGRFQPMKRVPVPEAGPGQAPGQPAPRPAEG
jgi:hypothetical protein